MDPITSTLIGRTSAIVATIVLALAASLVDTLDCDALQANWGRSVLSVGG